MKAFNKGYPLPNYTTKELQLIAIEVWDGLNTRNILELSDADLRFAVDAWLQTRILPIVRKVP